MIGLIPKKINFDNYSDNGSIVCLLEVYLDYPDDLHNDYPLADDKIKVTKEMSKYQLGLIEHNNFNFGKNEKLIPNLCNRKDTNSSIKI